MRSMVENTLSREESGYAFYIPSRQTLTGINDIKTPSFLVILHKAGYAGCDDTLDAAITGLKAIRKIKTVGYRDEYGNYKYCYESQQASGDYDILEYFNSPEDAARAGYTVDYRYIFNRIEHVPFYHVPAEQP